MKTNYQTKKLEDSIEKVIYTNKILKKDFLEIGEYPIISQEQDLINGYWNDTEDLFKIKKPIVIFGDHTKVLKYIDFDFVLGADGVKILQPKGFLYSKYLFYFLLSIKIKDLGYARHYRLIKNLEIPTPSLAKQKRIVKILDEVFEKLEKVKEGTEKNLANTKELFESYLQNVFANKGEDWEEKEFEDCIEKNTYTNKILKKDFLGTGEYPIISQEQDLINGYWNDTKDLFKIKKPIIIFGDHTKVLKYIDFNFVLGADGVKILQPKNFLYTKYFYYCLQSVKIKDLGYARHYRLLKNIEISFPKSLTKQKEIVKKLDDLSEQTKKLENIYKEKLKDIEELKKSILQKAFTGNL